MQDYGYNEPFIFNDLIDMFLVKISRQNICLTRIERGRGKCITPTISYNGGSTYAFMPVFWQLHRV